MRLKSARHTSGHLQSPGGVLSLRKSKLVILNYINCFNPETKAAALTMQTPGVHCTAASGLNRFIVCLLTKTQCPFVCLGCVSTLECGKQEKGENGLLPHLPERLSRIELPN